MSDVGKIKGNTQPPEPGKSKRKSDPDMEEIREKWSKVGKVDPDQKKEKKPKAQQEAETAAETASFSQGLPTEPQSAPPSYGSQEDGGIQIPESSSSLPPTSPSYAPQSVAPEQTKKKKKTEKKGALTRSEPRKKVGKGEPGPKLKTKPTSPLVKTLDKETETLAKKSPPLKQEKKKESPQTLLPPPPSPPLPIGAWEKVKETEKSEKKEGDKSPSLELAPPPLPSDKTPAPPPSTYSPPPLQAPFAHLPHPVQQLFERMVGVMTVLHASGITETTLHLDNPQFAQSPFFGAQIIITEFSTAPKAFNIELLGNQKAVQLFSENAEELVAAFQAGKYTFKVNRVDTGYLPPVGEARRQEARRVKRKKT